MEIFCIAFIFGNEQVAVTEKSEKRLWHCNVAGGIYVYTYIHTAGVWHVVNSHG